MHNNKLILLVSFILSACVTSSPTKQAPSTQQTQKTTVQIYQKSCAKGHSNDCDNLGYLYELGSIVQQDYKRAAELYGIACNRNYSLGCSHLGHLYQEGYGVEKNPNEAVRLYKKACTRGDALGCDYLRKITG